MPNVGWYRGLEFLGVQDTRRIFTSSRPLLHPLSLRAHEKEIGVRARKLRSASEEQAHLVA